MNTVLINGVKIYPFSSSDDLIDYMSEKKGILIAINAEKILHATDLTRRIINRNIGYCDGIGAVLAMRKYGFKNVVKIPGCELWLKLIKASYRAGKSYYFVGSTQEVIDSTIDKLRIDFPGINIAGYRNGYIKTEKEKSALIDDIVAKEPDYVFVAMGSPKQELLMEEMIERHPAIYQGLGGSFDVYTGKVERAPKWWVSHNLEFAYRLIKQPARIKRQIHLVEFLYKLYLGKF